MNNYRRRPIDLYSTNSREYRKRNRKAFFWFLVGDSMPFLLLGYLIGYALGAWLVFYVLFWPIIKALFGFWSILYFKWGGSMRTGGYENSNSFLIIIKYYLMNLWLLYIFTLSANTYWLLYNLFESKKELLSQNLSWGLVSSSLQMSTYLLYWITIGL